jgi:hypothetical protein
MKALLKEPFVHFVLGGLALFVFVEYNAPGAWATEGQIVVDHDALLNFAQFRMKAFEPEAIGDMFDELTQEELEILAADYAREEVLYREALALELDRNDYVIRQRLVQKLRFIHEEMAKVAAPPDEKAVHDYFVANRGDYEQAAAITFTHVFFDARKHGQHAAMQLANEKLGELVAVEVPYSESLGHGDRFLYNRNYVDSSAGQISDHFGESFARQMFGSSIMTNEWVGPIESPHGFHIVRIAARTSRHEPEFEEVKDLVAADALRAITRRYANQSIDRLVDDYDVQFRYAN